MIGQDVLKPLLSESNNSSEATFMCLRDEVRELEKRKIVEAMLKTDGIKTRAAELLQISYKSFCEKLKEYKIESVSGQ
jgi:DNA-binding NtrC family response regulator